MPEKLEIKSSSGAYSVEFTGNFRGDLEREAEQGAIAIIDSNVLRIYKDAVQSALRGKEFIVIEADERNKTLDKCKELIESLVDKNFRRDHKIIAVGGGVIQDISAFTASVLYRGVQWVFFPTTLLAMADSCIGGKTSINLGGKKNLIGNFYPPGKVFIDTGFAGSLSEKDIKSGIGEMMHFYLYAGSPYFKKIVKNHAKILKNRKLFAEYILASLAIKKSVIEADEFDAGERQKFNYGHTFGHALESVTDFRITHGQAVTIGMDIANFISHKTGLMDGKIFGDIRRGLEVNFPDYNLSLIDLDAYIGALSKDKKNEGANIGCILAEAPGKLLKKQIPADGALRKLLKDYFKTP